ncbi:MAG: hypothetical protein OXC69_08555 [Candidatus Tectomicrobia bacterium]|nr:hypothetical protein [Candidatus Tectomicrobia bacterium]
MKKLSQCLGEVAAGTVHVPQQKAGVVRMRELFDMVEQFYRLNERLSPTHRSCLKKLRRRFGSHMIESCTGAAIRHHMSERLRSGRKPGTVNRDLNVLRVAYSLGYENDLVTRVPLIKKLPEPTVRNEFFTREEIDSLMPCLPEHLRDVVLFG